MSERSWLELWRNCKSSPSIFSFYFHKPFYLFKFYPMSLLFYIYLNIWNFSIINCNIGFFVFFSRFFVFKFTNLVTQSFKYFKNLKLWLDYLPNSYLYFHINYKFWNLSFFIQYFHFNLINTFLKELLSHKGSSKVN